MPNQGGRIMALAYSPDGKKLASCTMEEPEVKLWDPNSGKLLKSIPIEDCEPISLAWSPDGKRLAVGYLRYNRGVGCISIFDAETGAEIYDVWTGYPYSLSWTPDGRRLITACNFSDAQFIRVYDAISWQEL